jgi:hypothetical protein
MDAYSKGPNGKAAAWANRRYRGHRMLPETILAEYEAENGPMTLIHDVNISIPTQS